MSGRPGPGALIGLVVGVVLVAVVLLLPAALAGDFYEFSDPLIYMGLPMITISTADRLNAPGYAGGTRSEVGHQ